MKYIKIINFKKYQQHTDRKIHWLKLHIDILNDYKIRQLNEFQRWVWCALLCLSATHLGQVEYDLDYIKERICVKHTRTKQLRLAINKLILLQMLEINCALDKKRIDKKRIEQTTTTGFKKTSNDLTPLKEIINEKRRSH